MQAYVSALPSRMVTGRDSGGSGDGGDRDLRASANEQMFRLLLELRRLHSLDREGMTYRSAMPPPA